jgi:quercetin dioxygenase-like cupin family protein
MGYFNIEQLKKLVLAEGVALRLVSGDKMTMAFYSLNPHAIIPEHDHPHEQMGTVLKGSLRLNIGGTEKIVTPGTAYHVPSGIPHSGKCLEAPCEVIEIFSPPREDLLKKLKPVD